MNDHYILAEDGKTPIPVDLMTWARAFENNDKGRVDHTELPDGTYVSTVFLGLDHSYARFTGAPHAPVLWETMIFGGPHDQYQDRYTSHAAAVAGHAKAVRIAKGEEQPE